MSVIDSLPDVLTTILEYKKEWIAHQRRRRPLQEVRARANDGTDTRGFSRAIEAMIERERPAVIAEIKRASPSQGLIREDFKPAEIARSYADNHAACISVLTDVRFFQGDDAHLADARNACGVPVLRKDFIMEPYQIYESRLIGADCVLLIVAMLSDMQLQDLAGLAMELDMDVLIEVHDRPQLQRGLTLETPLIGINNRDLHSFKTDLQTTLDLLSDTFADRIVITESGIHTREQVQLMRANKVHGFLVGEAFMLAPDPGRALTSLFFSNEV